ncbi:pentapeptide repeat-containing protein [Pasteurella multocida]|uniref:pentapeptide repeat-containing protein n=1 Tax=Pasteurella multocida TaxID=747 RepID=UPI001CE13CD6|nr:pentapeptide repeat-containing protein [Pasteurella multocida]UBU75186.1 pentapeptide repeat-containing protein [Pasteurella multocida]UZT14363.1 pentapeptide repeat-containing protein [Pasteurella multocida]UZT16901.1 pentapeptide repeat-containing protein [Pasteurella multocida]UZU32954.1 pentapeptide repeat-containing protein [Pasteurella multocida]UZU37611.1 pentapeptide repeat-containing protein [Pasteurella multocida]
MKKQSSEKLNIARISLVLFFAVLSYCILYYLAYSDEPIIEVLKNKIGDSRGLWTLITAIITAPIAFIIWVFRDINAKQQIENQRKDINLKEFQKIAEWVSGLHLIEDEVTEKIVNQTEQEKTRKYTQQSEHLSISTFSKKDGAVGLQIAAIYNLLPFYRGEHGESFKKPALNLLLSAWLALQQKEVKNLENFDVLTNRLDFDNTVKKIQENGRSPIGIAITHVLLADGGEHLVQYPEVFPNLCLAGMDFHLPGLDKNVLSLFINIKSKDCSGINLMAANLNNVRLEGASLENASLGGASLNGASLYKASLNGASLYKASLEGARLNWASLEGARLERASLEGASLNWASLEGARLNWASLEGASLEGARLNWASLEGASLEGARLNWASLEGASLERASLEGASLEGASLERVSLERASLEGASLEGAIFTYNTDSNINCADLKSKGGVILYFTASEKKRDICIQLVKAEATFEHDVPDNIDIEKTQQENPDWKIFIIK